MLWIATMLIIFFMVPGNEENNCIILFIYGTKYEGLKHLVTFYPTRFLFLFLDPYRDRVDRSKM